MNREQEKILNENGPFVQATNVTYKLDPNVFQNTVSLTCSMANCCYLLYWYNQSKSVIVITNNNIEDEG